MQATPFLLKMNPLIPSPSEKSLGASRSTERRCHPIPENSLHLRSSLNRCRRKSHESSTCVIPKTDEHSLNIGQYISFNYRIDLLFTENTKKIFKSVGQTIGSFENQYGSDMRIFPTPRTEHLCLNMRDVAKHRLGNNAIPDLSA